MKIVINQSYKSIPQGISFELPPFCVLTGINGSGKSHLLEAMANRTHANVFIDGIQAVNIQHVGFNDLNPRVDEQCDSNQVMSNVRNWWNQINSIVPHYKMCISQGQQFNNISSEYLQVYHGHNSALNSMIYRVLTKSGKQLDELTEDDILNNVSFVNSDQSQLFFSQCALIFKSYHSRKIKNEFAEFRASKHTSTAIPFLSDAEFIRKYGPPPWVLINEVLERANLPYEVTSPELVDFELPYILRLVDRKKNIDISVNDLSSGEKVLMSLALAIYNTQEGGSKPDLLLLDEPDAPLHPQFSKLLIDTVIETIVKKTGVNVIISTHSPSTVAMTPDGSVFEIDRETKTPRMVSNAHAVGILTTGINFLKVSYEQRKQVFVESKYDVEYFQRLHNLLSRKHQFNYQPIFLEPHSGTSNCTDVISIVGKLRDSGSDIAFGIIDFDGKNTSNDSIVVLGEGNRYSIENYLLDPMYIILVLIRYGKKNFADFSVTGKHSYIDAASLSQQECQTMIDTFLSIVGISLDEMLATTLENGFILNYPKSFLFYQGHGYETLIKSKFPELNAVSRGSGDAALKLGVMQVIEEYPQFLPCELADTLKKVLVANI